VKPIRAGDATRQRRDRIIQEAIHDPYKAAVKPSEPSVCSECGVVFQNGRWQWSPELPTNAADALCPACMRIRDRVPAGVLTLGGSFLQKHRDDIMHLLRNTVDAQQREHPVKRIMDIAEAGGEVEVTFTDTHLPRTVGEAIRRAYDGVLEIKFAEESGIARANWSRND
jgi:NMD protein affecting ribosome stability and mRNA decay